MRMRGFPIAGNRVVRCRSGHLFTTLWIAGASVKSLRLLWWRIQYCPVGRHWTIVTPVHESSLTDSERSFAADHRDTWLP